MDNKEIKYEDWEKYADDFDRLPKEIVEGLRLAGEVLKRKQAQNEVKTSTIH